MNVTAVSIYSHSRANNLKGKQEHPSNFSPKKSAAPSFGDAWLGKLSEQEIKSLYGDGKKLWALMSEAIPVLGKKVGDMLSVRIDLHPDVLRYMSVHVKTEHNKMDEMLDYIVKNNDKKFGFPKPLIDSFKKIDKIAYEYNEDGYVKIVVKSFDETIEVILNNLLDALKDLELQYPENIKIKQ